MKKIYAILILSALLVSAAASCAQSIPDSGVQSEQPVQTGDVAAISDTVLFAADDLPDNLDFDGKEITIMYREEEIREFINTEQTGDVVDDAVYESNRNVEERLNILLTAFAMRGNATDDRTAFVNHVTSTVQAGDDAFQIVGALTYNMPAFIQNGVVMNMLDLPYADFDKPWWVQDLVRYGTLGGRLYLASGDISLSLIKKTLCLYFNINLAGSLGLDSPYDLVNSGAWTRENMDTAAKSVYMDLNGDGQVNTDDCYGYAVYDRNHLNMYIGAYDLEVTANDENGYPTIVFGGDKTAAAVEYLCGLFADYPGIAINKLSDAGNDLSMHQALRKMFTEGRLLFVSAEFNNAEFYRDMKDEYGILPAPKWDENQAGYYTVARNVYSSFAVPVTCSDPDLTGAVLEALA
ncbi:MAG: hypothetical protein PHZ09_07430, partial [Eubacteriales bacterium]|nr:hypothetical protein [Eubacteriales bacterium]